MMEGKLSWTVLLPLLLLLLHICFPTLCQRSSRTLISFLPHRRRFIHPWDDNLPQLCQSFRLVSVPQSAGRDLYPTREVPGPGDPLSAMHLSGTRQNKRKSKLDPLPSIKIDGPTPPASIAEQAAPAPASTSAPRPPSSSTLASSQVEPGIALSSSSPSKPDRPPLPRSLTSWLIADIDLDDLYSFPAIVDPYSNSTIVDMESPMMTTVPVLPKLRTIRFNPVIFKSGEDDRYLSEEEDVSSSGDETLPSPDEWDPLSLATDEDLFIATAASDIDEHVARVITFIAPGKPRLIDVNTFSPVQRRRLSPLLHSTGKLPEPAVRRRIREGRELDRLLKSRTWLAKALGHEDPYGPRRLTVTPLEGLGGRPFHDASISPRRAHSAGYPLDVESSLLASCDPLRMTAAQSKLRGVAQSLMTAKRRTRFPDTLC